MADPFTQAEHEGFMRQAIALAAKAGIEEKTGGCFGCVIVDKATKQVIGQASNHVLAKNDPTAHAEVEAIRECCPRLGRTHLQGTILYSSGESCPMCMCAAMWARVDQVFYASTFEDAKKYGKFEDEDFLAELAKPGAERKPPCAELLRDEAVEVWKKYEAMGDAVHY